MATTKKVINTNKSSFDKIVIFILYFVTAEHQPLLLSSHHPSGDAVLGHVQHPVSALQDRHTLLPFRQQPEEKVDGGSVVGGGAGVMLYLSASRAGRRGQCTQVLFVQMGGSG